MKALCRNEKLGNCWAADGRENCFWKKFEDWKINWTLCLAALLSSWQRSWARYACPFLALPMHCAWELQSGFTSGTFLRPPSFRGPFLNLSANFGILNAKIWAFKMLFLEFKMPPFWCFIYVLYILTKMMRGSPYLREVLILWARRSYWSNRC